MKGGYFVMNSFKEQFEKNKNLSYLERKNFQADNYLLQCIKIGKFSEFIRLGMDSRLPNVDEAISIGNVQFILESIYRNYSLYPQNQINVLFENTLIEMLNSNFYNFYAAMDTINRHLQYEISGKATFSIQNENVYKSLKQAIMKNYQNIDNKKYYAGQMYENGLTGYVEILNNLTEEIKGISIL